MKKLFIALSSAAMVCCSVLSAYGNTGTKPSAKNARVYLNPGHGSWTSNDRPMTIIREVNGVTKVISPNTSMSAGVKPDTTAFYESNTNLVKSMAMKDKLLQYGVTMSNKPYNGLDMKNNIVLSRIKNGPYPLDGNKSGAYNKLLSTICAEVKANNFDAFVSIHSNAATDGTSTNYLIFLYRGTTGAGGDTFKNSRDMCLKAHPHQFKNPYQHWGSMLSATAGTAGDKSFFGYTLGALSNNTQGYLTEGYFHTYQPARLRAMQFATNRMEGYAYSRGLADFFGWTKESTGDIYGVIRQKGVTFTHTYYKPKSGTNDVYKPLNGVTVTLSGNGVNKTFVTDNHYNGAFVFADLPVGTYTVTCSKNGFATTTTSVTVKAADTTFPEIFMEEGQSVSPTKGDPISLTEAWNFSTAKNSDWGNGTNQGSRVRNFCYSDGKLYCVYDMRAVEGYDHSYDILVLDAVTGKQLGMLPYNKELITGGTYELCDVKAIDGHIIACNLVTNSATQKLRFYCWDSDTSEPYLLKEVDDARGATRLGDCMEISGSFDDEMYITFCNDDNTTTRLIEFRRADGQNWSGRVYPVTTDGTTQFKTNISTRATKVNGGWWTNGNACSPTFVALNDNNVAVVKKSYKKTGYDASYREFKWGEDLYSAYIDFEPTSYTNAKLRLDVNNVGDYQTPTNIVTVPAAGLGSDTNANGTADVQIRTDNSTYAQFWINSDKQGIAYYTVGNPPADNPAPTLSLNADAMSFDVVEEATQTKSVHATGSRLQGPITATISGDDAAMFKLNVASLNRSGDFEVVYQPTELGKHRATLTIATTGTTSKSVALTGRCLQNISFNDEVTDLQTNWTYSTNAGNVAAASKWLNVDATDKFTRDIEHINGKLYVLNCKDFEVGDINVINASNGEYIRTLSTEGISSDAVVPLSGLSSIGGKLIASNRVYGGKLTVYKWDNDVAEPTVWFSDDTHGDALNVGAQINTSGDLDKGYIWITNAKIVLRYSVANGEVNPTPTVIKLSDALDDSGNLIPDTEELFTQNGCGDVTAMPDGSFWVTAAYSMPKYYKANGQYVGTLRISTPSKPENGEEWSEQFSPQQGTGLVIIPFGNRTYMGINTYISYYESVSGGAMMLVDVTGLMEDLDVVTEASFSDVIKPVCTYPANGLGTARNTTFQTGIDYVVKNDQLTMFAAVPYQGVTSYTYSDPAAKSLAVDIDNLVMSTVVGGTTTSMIKVNSKNLSSTISATLTGSSCFTMDASELNTTGVINVTYAPVEGESSRALISLSSDGVDDVVVAVLGEIALYDPTSGVESANDKAASLVAYPNPLTATTTLRSSKPLGEVKVYSMDGRMVKKADLGDATMAVLDLSQLNHGIYLAISSNGQRTYLVKQ